MKQKLTETNIPRYLIEHRLFENIFAKDISVKEITEYTNVNFVFRVDIKPKKQRFYIKQAFDYVKIAPTFAAPIERHRFEKESIEYLQKFWKARIPEVVYYDHENNVLITTDVGKNALLLADEIKNGCLHFDAGSDLAKMMGELHFPTYGKEAFPVRDQKANKEHVNFILDFRLRGARELAKKEANELFCESLKSNSSMIYGDWASKNIFVANRKIRLVDFENLVRFDPAFDIGYALAHWILEISKENKKQLEIFLTEFENQYRTPWKENDLNGLLNRSTRYIGAMMLHRLAGVKNTNRLDEYLKRNVPLIDVAKQLISIRDYIPSKAIKEIKL